MWKSSCPEVLCKKVFLNISQNSQGNACARVSSLTKVAGPCNFNKKRRPFFYNIPKAASLCAATSGIQNLQITWILKSTTNSFPRNPIKFKHFIKFCGIFWFTKFVKLFGGVFGALSNICDRASLQK